MTNILVDYSLQKAEEIWNRRCTAKHKYMTVSKSARRYADINSGCEHPLHEKYPRMLLIVFMAMFYGFGLPVIMILTCLCLIITYVFDKIIVAWYHRKPPLYDDTLSRNAIYFMKWGGALYASVSYWMLGN